MNAPMHPRSSGPVRGCSAVVGSVDKTIRWNRMKVWMSYLCRRLGVSGQPNLGAQSCAEAELGLAAVVGFVAALVMFLRWAWVSYGSRLTEGRLRWLSADVVYFSGFCGADLVGLGVGVHSTPALAGIPVTDTEE